MSKAVDHVPHTLLIDRLRDAALPERLILWLQAYLNNRSQFVECAGVRSAALPVLSGVPQGSVLGPLLSLIYINSIASNIDHSVTVKLFADNCVSVNNSLCKLAEYENETVCKSILIKQLL